LTVAMATVNQGSSDGCTYRRPFQHVGWW
jgi:hypothetical protein